MKISQEFLARVAADPKWAAEVLAAAAVAYNALQDGLPRCRHCHGETTVDGDSVVLSPRSTLATAFMEPFDLGGSRK
jgi:hypothetical protein